MADYLTLIQAFRPGDPREEADKALTLDCCRRYGPLVLTREALAAHITSSALVLSPDRRWVLMAWHNIYRSWAWVGGHADGDGDLLRAYSRSPGAPNGRVFFRPARQKIAGILAVLQDFLTQQGGKISV